MIPNPQISEGARLERAAFRNYLRRKINALIKSSHGMFGDFIDTSDFVTVLNWVLARQKRYDKKTGGLGRK